MNKDKIKGLYGLWVLVLLAEIGWLYSVNDKADSVEDLISVVTVIAVTLTLGAVGLKVFADN